MHICFNIYAESKSGAPTYYSSDFMGFFPWQGAFCDGYQKCVSGRRHREKCNYREDLQWLPYAEEADLLNVALFGFTAKAWRDANPELAGKSNVRDYATINELTVLSNLESHNAQMIREGKGKMDRFMSLKEIAEYQLRVLNEAEKINNRIEGQ